MQQSQFDRKAQKLAPFKNMVARDSAPNDLISDEFHIRDLAPVRHSSEETSQRWRAVGDTVFDLTGSEIEPQTSRADSDVLTYYAMAGLMMLLVGSVAQRVGALFLRRS